MAETRYSVFRTRWGWFGLYGSSRGLIRTCLPVPSKSALEKAFLKGAGPAKADQSFFRPLQNSIISYYEGNYVDFSKVKVSLEGLTDFQQQVLHSLQKVKYGKTISYKQLSEMTGRPKAVRAVGQVVAHNPLPLIIPCHRVIRKDGSLGGFSAQGGIEMKKKMLQLETSNIEKIKT